MSTAQMERIFLTLIE